MRRTGNPRRLPHFDYASPGEYFVTFCTHERRCVLGSIAPEGICVPSEYGSSCLGHALRISENHPGFSVVATVVMPNHVHGLIRVDAHGETLTPVSLSRVVGWWKARVTKDAHGQGFEGILWQKSFHDHIVRDEADRLRLLEYIQNNPKQWQLDRFYQGPPVPGPH